MRAADLGKRVRVIRFRSPGCLNSRLPVGVRGPGLAKQVAPVFRHQQSNRIRRRGLVLRYAQFRTARRLLYCTSFNNSGLEPIASFDLAMISSTAASLCFF